MDKKKLLLISYHFPPDSAVGGLRAAKFARFLPESGFDTFVLTIKERYLEKPDPKRLKDVEGITTFRTMELPTVRTTYLGLKRLLRPNLDISEFVQAGPVSVSSPGGALTGREGLKRRLKRYFLSLFISLPDDQRKWVIPAAVRAVIEIRRRGITHIMTSSPPHSVQLIGLVVKRLTGVFWVADFRDPWVETIECKPPSVRSSLSERIERWLENKTMRNADRVVTTTESFRRSLLERYPRLPAEKFVYIPNGIDTSQFAERTATEKYKTFTITYTGTIYEGRTPEPVFEAIRGLIRDGMIKRSEIRVRLVGHCGNICGKDTLSVIKSYGMDDIVEVLRPVPYPDALAMLRRSHLLLLLAPSQPLAVPAKVYDYLGAGTDIIALTEEGATSDLIRETGSGRCFTHNDIEGIGRYILETMQNREGGSRRDDLKDRSRFDIRVLAKKLADELSSAGPPLGTGSIELKNGI